MAAFYQQAHAPAVGVGQVIRHHRVRLHLSQSDLARKCGYDRTTISRIESGERTASADVLHDIADALRLGSVDLVVLLSHGGCMPLPIDELRAHILIDYWNERLAAD